MTLRSLVRSLVFIAQIVLIGSISFAWGRGTEPRRTDVTQVVAPSISAVTGAGASAASVPCETDGTSSPVERGLSYEQCSTGPEAASPRSQDRTYYERAIQGSSDSLVILYRSTPLRDEFARCVQTALLSPTDRIQTSCEGGPRGGRGSRGPVRSGSVARDLPRVCASQTMNRFISHAFLDATACFGVDRRELFAKMFHESRLQPAAVGPSKDGGFGQLTCQFLEDFHAPRDRRCSGAGNGRNRYAEMVEELRRVSRSETGDAQKRSACQRLASVIEGRPPPSSLASERCETMYPPENGIRNMVMAAYQHGEARDAFVASLSPVDEAPEVRARFAEFRARVASRLATASHNSPASARAMGRVARASAGLVGGRLSIDEIVDGIGRRSSSRGYLAAIRDSAQSLPQPQRGECTYAN